MMNRRSVLAYFMTLCIVLFFLVLIGENEYTELTFSEESGFYDNAFRLRIYAPRGTEIYYTLDGSVPDENALQYMEPILIKDATENDNVHSTRDDMTSGFLKEDILLYGQEPPNYVIPDYLVDKCTVVRAAYRDAEGNFSEVETRNYFVGFQDKEGYAGFNIISIVAEPDDLFGYEDGIYVRGKLYDAYVNEADRSAIPWVWWGANYHQHGKEWERDCNVQIFNAGKMQLLDKECGVRIQGGGGRGYLPRSLNLYARRQYDEEGRFYTDLFGTNYMADTVTLFAGGGDVTSKLRDRLAAGLIRGRNFGTMHFEPYIMFLNGEYWGVYWLTEKYDNVFVAYYYDVNKDDVVMIKNGELAEGKEEDYALYTKMMEYMENTDFTVDENYAQACEILDMQSFIDYFAAEIYYGRYGDWPASNFALWRTREKGEGEYEDCKWRWLMFDVNSGALKSESVEWDVLRFTMDSSRMFYNLCQNEDFKRQFVTSFMDIINTSFAEEKVNSMISDHLTIMEDAMYVHLKRFLGAEDTQMFQEAVADVQFFMDNRAAYVVQHLKNDLGLLGSLALLRVEINDTDAGKIKVNTADITFDQATEWYGAYYTDYQVTLTAVPEEGYHFVRWENEGVSEEETIVIDMQEKGISIKAIFEKE